MNKPLINILLMASSTALILGCGAEQPPAAEAEPVPETAAEFVA